MVTGRLIREDVCLRLCHSPGGLLQHGTRWCTEVCHWQTVAGIECCCTSCQRNAQVRPWTVAAATCRLALTRCGRSSSVQARCLHNKAPKYLTVCCVAVSDIAGRQRLRSAHRRQLDVPRYRRTTLSRRVFSVAGPTVWNSLPDELREETENVAFHTILVCSAH